MIINKTSKITTYNSKSFEKSYQKVKRTLTLENRKLHKLNLLVTTLHYNATLFTIKAGTLLLVTTVHYEAC